MDYESIKTDLLAKDNEFKRLHREHQDCEGRLEQLENEDLQPNDYEIQAKPIKLHKLALKDRMEQMIRDHVPAAS